MTADQAGTDRPVAAPDGFVVERVPYVDWLRVLALAGVFVIHVCSPFNPWDHWHIRNGETSKSLGAMVILMAPWIMPLFMLLAGTSAWYSLRRRSNSEYVRDRVLRILVPLMLGMLILVPPQVYAERYVYGEFAGSFLDFYPRFFEGGLYPRGNFSWHHLWFLGYLFAYSLLALPLFRFWRGHHGQRQLRWLATFSRGWIGMLWLAIPILVERYLFWFAVGRRNPLLADWSGRSILFVLYAYGFALAAEPGFGRNIDAQWRRFLALGAVGTATLVALAWTGAIPSRLPPTSEWWALGFWSLYAVGAWSWVVGVLGFGRRYLTRETGTLQRARRGGLVWYLVHQPVIVLLAAVLITWRLRVPEKFALLLATSATATALLVLAVNALKPLASRRRAAHPVGA